MNLLDLWYQALKSGPVGIGIKSDDRNTLRSQLWRVRKESGDPDLQELFIMLPVGSDELWIIRHDADKGMPQVWDVDGKGNDSGDA